MELNQILNVFNIGLSCLMLFFVLSIWRRLRQEKDLIRSMLFLNTDRLFLPTASFSIGVSLFLVEQTSAFILAHHQMTIIHRMVESLYITFTLLGLVLLTNEVLKIKNDNYKI
jgi:hypothetical protein